MDSKDTFSTPNRTGILWERPKDLLHHTSFRNFSSLQRISLCQSRINKLRNKSRYSVKARIITLHSKRSQTSSKADTATSTPISISNFLASSRATKACFHREFQLGDLSMELKLKTPILEHNFLQDNLLANKFYRVEMTKTKASSPTLQKNKNN